MNNIAIGQYINTNSWIHRLDPRIKILGVFIALVSIFIIPIPKWNLPDHTADYVRMIMLAVMIVGVILLILTAKIPLKKVMNGLKPIVVLLTFTFVMQVIYSHDGTALYHTNISFGVITILVLVIALVFYHQTKKYIPFRTLYFFLMVIGLFFILTIDFKYLNFTANQPFTIYDQGVIRAAFLFFRITGVIMFTSLLTFTTMTTDLNYGIESLLSPLKKIKVPVEVLSMMISLTLRSIPTLLEETEKIMKAQSSRGSDFKESKLKEKVVQIIALLIPVFVISFKRSEELANAMEARGYVLGQKRSRIDTYKLGFVDYFSLFVLVGVLTASIVLRVLI